MISNHSKSALASLLATAVLAALAPTASADILTVNGEGRCEKGHLTVIRVREGSKLVTYHLKENDVSRDFHGKVCAKPAKVKAVGDVRDVNGRWEMTATKLELVKDKENENGK